MRKKFTKFKQTTTNTEFYKYGFYSIPFLVLAVVLLLFLATKVGLRNASTGSADAHIIILSSDGQTRPVPSRARTVKEFLERADLSLNPNDRVEPDLDSEINSDKYHINIYRARPITVIRSGKKIYAMNAGATPRSIVKQSGIDVYPEDKLKTEMPHDILKDGLGVKVKIDPATPVTVNLYGSQLNLRTHSLTVGDLFKDKNIQIGKDDSVQPDLSARIMANMQIFVYRTGTEIKTEEEDIPMPVEVVEDSSLSFGAQAIRQAGAVGKRVITYEIELRNGQEIGRKKIQEVITTPPVKQIVARGPQGDFGQALARLRQCEAGGNYQINTGNGYYGAYQYDISTWNGYGGYTIPSDAPPAMQDQKATETYSRRGWQPWPGCTSKLGLQDIYR